MKKYCIVLYEPDCTHEYRDCIIMETSGNTIAFQTGNGKEIVFNGVWMYTEEEERTAKTVKNL